MDVIMIVRTRVRTRFFDLFFFIQIIFLFSILIVETIQVDSAETIRVG